MIGAWAALLLAAQATGEPALAPASKWEVNYGSLECTLARSFGSRTNLVTLGMKTYLRKGYGEMVLVLRGPAPAGARQGKGRVLLSPSGTATDAQWVRVPLSDGTRGVSVGVDPSFWAALGQADTITLEVGEAAPISLKTGAMSKAAAALDACQAAQIRSLGADPNAMVAPYPDQLVGLFGPDNYPRDAIRANAEGKVTALVTVNRTGVPVACRPVVSAPHRSLDEATCTNVMRGARFPSAPEAGPDTRFSIVSVYWAIPR